MAENSIFSLALVNSQNYAASSTNYSLSFKSDKINGLASCVISNSAGDLKVTQQCSSDDSVWYNPVDENNVTLGLVASGMGVGTVRFVQFDPVLSPYTRFMMISANTTATKVSMLGFYQE